LKVLAQLPKPAKAIWRRANRRELARLADGPTPAVNRPGFGHIAFAVDSVPDARAEVLAAGGQSIGEIVALTTAVGRQVTWCYVTDPEGNIVELQSWK
jgi:predicted enzyme related to lactoylglutathione lyase